MDEIVKIEHLTKTYGRGEGAVTALHDVNLEIRRGEIFGVIGLSGAGKSTLVRCMNLLETPTEGRVWVDGAELTALPPKALRRARRGIGMIFQSFNLLMQRTALENICFPLELEGVSRQQARARGQELLEIVGLADKAEAYPAQLSGGQKQRVAIARAVANNPALLLCDEATSALDPNTTRAILALLADINRSMGVSIVVITHEMKVIEQICHRVAVVDSSRIVELGTVEEVFTHPKSRIARELLLPAEGEGADAEGGMPEEVRGRLLRVVFHGGSASEPLIASLAADCGVKVSIMQADTRTIQGGAYGSMLICLPQEPEQAQKAIDYLNACEGVQTQEVQNGP